MLNWRARIVDGIDGAREGRQVGGCGGGFLSTDGSSLGLAGNGIGGNDVYLAERTKICRPLTLSVRFAVAVGMEHRIVDTDMIYVLLIQSLYCYAEKTPVITSAMIELA